MSKETLKNATMDSFGKEILQCRELKPQSTGICTCVYGFVWKLRKCTYRDSTPIWQDNSQPKLTQKVSRIQSQGDCKMSSRNVQKSFWEASGLPHGNKEVREYHVWRKKTTW